METALEHDTLDGPLDSFDQTVTGHRGHYVVLRTGEQKDRCGDRAEPGRHFAGRGKERPGRPQRQFGIGRLDCTLEGDVRPPSIMASMNATVSASGGWMSGLTRTSAAISGWRSASHTLSVPPMESPTTTTDSQRVANSM